MVWKYKCPPQLYVVIIYVMLSQLHMHNACLSCNKRSSQNCDSAEHGTNGQNINNMSMCSTTYLNVKLCDNK